LISGEVQLFRCVHRVSNTLKVIRHDNEASYQSLGVFDCSIKEVLFISEASIILSRSIRLSVNLSTLLFIKNIKKKLNAIVSALGCRVVFVCNCKKRLKRLRVFAYCNRKASLLKSNV
jgi:hypothetical protein